MLQLSAIGRIGKDAETKDFNGKLVANFSIGVDVGFGEKKSTQWINCSIWNREKLVPFLKKGIKVYIQGEPSIRSYMDKIGKPCSNFDLNVNVIELLDSKNEKPEFKPEPKPEIVHDNYDLPF